MPPGNHRARNRRRTKGGKMNTHRPINQTSCHNGDAIMQYLIRVFACARFYRRMRWECILRDRRPKRDRRCKASRFRKNWRPCSTTKRSAWSMSISRESTRTRSWTIRERSSRSCSTRRELSETDRESLRGSLGPSGARGTLELGSKQNSGEGRKSLARRFAGRPGSFFGRSDRWKVLSRLSLGGHPQT